MREVVCANGAKAHYEMAVAPLAQSMWPRSRGDSVKLAYVRDTGPYPRPSYLYAVVTHAHRKHSHGA